MKFMDKLKGQAVIRQVAQREGLSEGEVRRQMQAALDAAWDSTDGAVKAEQARLFPDGKPTLEQFILTVARATERG